MEFNNYKMPKDSTIMVTLLHDTPEERESEYGKFNVYTFDLNGKEVSMTASAGLHKQLINHSKGDYLKIVKAEYAPDRQSFKVTQEQSNGVVPKPSALTGSFTPDNRTADIHRQVCLKLAVQSMGVSGDLNYDEVKSRMESLLDVLDPKEVEKNPEPIPAPEETKEELPF